MMGGADGDAYRHFRTLACEVTLARLTWRVELNAFSTTSQCCFRSKQRLASESHADYSTRRQFVLMTFVSKRLLVSVREREQIGSSYLK